MGFKPRYKMVRPENVKVGDLICTLWPCTLMMRMWYPENIRVDRIEYRPNLRHPAERGVYKFFQSGSDEPFVQCIDWACKFGGYRRSSKA